MSEIAKIARLRLDDLVAMSGARISYGKLEVPVQCVGVAPLRGLPEIPESPVRALDSGLLACEVSMEVLGQGFLAAYTEGDNRDVVATDTMKNVILRHALEHDGSVPEGFLDALGRRFLDTYPEMEGLRLRARELPFAPVRVGAGAERSDRLFSLGGGDHGVAELELARAEAGSRSSRAQRPGRPAAAQDDRLGVHALRPRRRDDAARARRPAAVHPPRRALALRRPRRRPRRRPGALRRRGAGRATSSRRLPRVRRRSRSSTSCTRWGSGCWSASRGSPRSRSAARTTRTTRSRARTPARDRRAYTAAFPAWGLITLTLTR